MQLKSREKFHFSEKIREFNPKKSCALFYTTNQASHNELMPAIARSHEFRRSFGMVQNISKKKCVFDREIP